MKFPGKMCLKITLKVIKNQGFTLSLEYTFFKKPQGGWRVLAVLGLRFSEFDPEIMLDGMLNFKTHFMV